MEDEVEASVAHAADALTALAGLRSGTWDTSAAAPSGQPGDPPVEPPKWGVVARWKAMQWLEARSRQEPSASFSSNKIMKWVSAGSAALATRASARPPLGHCSQGGAQHG